MIFGLEIKALDIVDDVGADNLAHLLVLNPKQLEKGGDGLYGLDYVFAPDADETGDDFHPDLGVELLGVVVQQVDQVDREELQRVPVMLHHPLQEHRDVDEPLVLARRLLLDFDEKFLLIKGTLNSSISLRISGM